MALQLRNFPLAPKSAHTLMTRPLTATVCLKSTVVSWFISAFLTAFPAARRGVGQCFDRAGDGATGHDLTAAADDRIRSWQPILGVPQWVQHVTDPLDRSVLRIVGQVDEERAPRWGVTPPEDQCSQLGMGRADVDDIEGRNLQPANVGKSGFDEHVALSKELPGGATWSSLMAATQAGRRDAARMSVLSIQAWMASRREICF